MSDRKLLYASCMLVFMNLADALLTLRFIELQTAVEANPIMAYLLSVHPALFFFVKTLVVSTGAFFFYINRERLLARISLLLCVIIYFCVIVIHAYGIFFVEKGMGFGP